MKKITEFFVDSWMLFMFAVKTAWVITLHKPDRFGLVDKSEEEINERNIDK